jgi:hypothetical protein
MKVSLSLGLTLAAAGFVSAAQRGGQVPLLECGAHEDLEVICGTQAPEDLERAPDGARLIVSQFGGEGGLVLFDPRDQTFRPMTIRSDPEAGWGDAACPGPMTEPISAHGTSLGARPGGGSTAVYVVNHGGRETIEMFELAGSGDAWELIWRGCALAEEDYNDVAILPDGGFVATRPQALSTGGRGAFGQPGQPSGNIVRWTLEGGEAVLPGSEAAFPNGVVVSPDGTTMFFAAWTGREIHKYDLRTETEVAVASLDFMPDNLTWTEDGKVLAAGIQEFGGGFGVAEIDPDTLNARMVYESGEGPMAIGGVSVALQLGDWVYVGSFQGDRLVRIPR